MSIFNKLFGGNKTSTATATTTMTQTHAAPVTIDMSKHVANLETVLIDMSKNGKTNMVDHTARVAVAMDYSGSMSGMFSNGEVQEIVERLLPIALKFDDNGELESWLFSNDYERINPVTISNHQGYVKTVMMNSGMYMGGTNYSPVLKDIVKYYKDKHPSDVPAFIIFITDGDNFDESETNSIVRKLSEYNMFVQFVGIGNGSSFRYLRHLDELSGRKNDNTGFISVQDMNRLSDEQLYTEMLRQYNDWLNKK